jgi:hypothetical protein
MVTLGLAGLGAGSAAVFVTHLEAGPVALLAVGLVLLLVGAGGRLPSRLKFGENEATWDAVEEFVERVVEGVSPEQRPGLVEALNDLREAAPAAAAAGLGAVSGGVEYERLITDLVMQAVMEINQSSSPPLKCSIESFSGVSQKRTDTMISDGRGNVFLVEAKYSTSDYLPVALVEQVIAKASRLTPKDHSHGSVRVLLISNQPLSRPAGRRLRSAELQFVKVTSEADLPKLIDAIRTAFDLVS